MFKQLRFDFYKILKNTAIKIMFIVSFVLQFVLAADYFSKSNATVLSGMFTFSAEVAFIIIPIIGILICAKDFSSHYFKNIYSAINKFYYVLSKFICLLFFAVVYALQYFLCFLLCNLIFGSGIIYSFADTHYLYQYILEIVRWIVIMTTYGSAVILLTFIVKKEYIALIIILPYALFLGSILYDFINNMVGKTGTSFDVRNYTIFGVSIGYDGFSKIKDLLLFIALRLVYQAIMIVGSWLIISPRVKYKDKSLLDECNFDSNCLLRIDSVAKSFHKKTVLKSVDLTINKGEIYGLVGNNGAGKTTLLKLIYGLLLADSGTFKWKDGKSNTNVGAMIDGVGLYYDMSAYENLKAKALCLGCKYKKKDIEQRLAFVGLGDVAKKKVGKFSMGMKQRLAIALALVGEPKLLLLDEPTNSLDPQGINEIRKLIIKIRQEHDVTVIISSHLLEELAKVATQFCFLHKGKIIKQLSTAQLLEECGDLPLDEYYIKVTV